MKAKQIVTLTKTLPRIEPVNNACSYHVHTITYTFCLSYFGTDAVIAVSVFECCFVLWLVQLPVGCFKTSDLRSLSRMTYDKMSCIYCLHGLSFNFLS